MIVPISSIIIGERSRKHLGDIDALADSITDVGLLHPPVVTPDLHLIAGARRIAAMQSLGLVETPVTVAHNLTEALDLIRAERDENTCREPLLPSEEVALAERIWPAEAEAAAQREQAGKAVSDEPSGNFPEGTRGDTRDRVAAAIGGPSGRTLEKAKAVVEAAKQSPALAPLVDEMDRTGKVDRAYQQLKKQQRREASAKAAQELANTGDLFHLVHGDFQDLMRDLPDASVDLIFTDPPYDDETAPLYSHLAYHAERVLKPGGSLLAYVGHNTLGPVLASMTGCLRYWWTICMHHRGPSARLPGKYVIVEWKPLVWFVKGGRANSEYLVDFIDYSLPEGFKQEHDWQQHEEPARVCIEKLTQPGDTVLDPFMGSGTTLLAAIRLGRRGIGFDLDGAAVDIAKGRIHELCSARATPQSV